MSASSGQWNVWERVGIPPALVQGDPTTCTLSPSLPADWDSNPGCSWKHVLHMEPSSGCRSDPVQQSAPSWPRPGATPRLTSLKWDWFRPGSTWRCTWCPPANTLSSHPSVKTSRHPGGQQYLGVPVAPLPRDESSPQPGVSQVHL